MNTKIWYISCFPNFSIQPLTGTPFMLRNGKSRRHNFTAEKNKKVIYAGIMFNITAEFIFYI